MIAVQAWSRWGIRSDQRAPYQLQPIILGFEAVVLDIAPSPPYLGASLSVLHSCHINGTLILHFELTQKATPFVYLIFTIHQWGVLNWQVQPVVLGFEAAALDIAPSPPYLGAPLSVLCASSILHQWDLHLAFSKINPFSPSKCPTHQGFKANVLFLIGASVNEISHHVQYNRVSEVLPRAPPKLTPPADSCNYLT